MSASRPAAPLAGGTFVEEGELVLGELREAFLRVLEGVAPPGSLAKPADLQRRLDLGATLAWQVWRIAYAARPLAEARNVPGIGAVERFVRAARKRGASASTADGLRDAYTNFTNFVQRHADNRRTFDSIVSHFAERGEDTLGHQLRRSAFRSSRHFWGCEARTEVRCAIVNDADSHLPGAMDTGHLGGYLNLRRLRPGPLIVHSKRPQDIHNQGFGYREQFRIEPLVAPDDLVDGVPVLSQFSSRPLPPLRTRELETGDIVTELEPSGIGNESAVSFLTGQVVRNVPGPFAAGDSDQDPALSMFTWIRIPTESLIRDICVRRDRFRVLRSLVSVYADRTRSALAAPHAFLESDVLWAGERVEHLGRGAAALRTPAFPSYPEAFEYACERLEWSPDDFDVYRCRLDFPLVQTVVRTELHFEPES